MNKRLVLGVLGGISVVGMGLTGVSRGQGRLRYLTAETRPTVTALPAAAGQPQRFIMTFDNGWTVNEIQRDGSVTETYYRVYSNVRQIRPSTDEEAAPPPREDTPPAPDEDAAPDRDGTRDPNDEPDPGTDIDQDARPLRTVRPARPAR
jgi:hypothetical protein